MKHWSRWSTALILSATEACLILAGVAGCAGESDDGDDVVDGGTESGANDDGASASASAGATTNTDPSAGDSITTTAPGEGSEEGGSDPDGGGPTSDDGASGEAEASSEAGGGGGGSVSGAVIRSIDPAPDGDAIGTLFVGLLSACEADAPTVGDPTPIENADLSAPAAQVLYEITNVPDGTYYAVAFLDDNGNADPADPYADLNDLVTAEGFGPGCVEVTVANGEGTVAPAPVDLNFLYPF